MPDTLYAEVYSPNAPRQGLVRVPVYVTNDIVDPAIDPLACFMIPLCWHVTSPVSFCSTSSWWNNTSSFPSADRDRSIFLHLARWRD